MKKLYLVKSIFSSLIIITLISLVGCAENRAIVNNVDEREANEIIVYLASKGIAAQKIQAEVAEMGAAGPANVWNIMVHPDDAVEAMAILNKIGLPRRRGKSLLELFAKEGLMTSDKEETIRYQAGLEEELKNTIRKIDGVLDADVRISFPSAEALAAGVIPPKIKAAVYVKHQGIMEDPNKHLESKIKRLLAGSIDGLDFENVSVISDRSRFTEIELQPEKEMITPRYDREYVKIWSIIMTKNSTSRFRVLFFTLIFLVLLLGACSIILILKFYPLIQKAKVTITKEKKFPPGKS